MTKQLDLFSGKFKLTEVGLEVNGKPDFEEWMEYGQSLKILDGTARQFAIGDWIVMGFETYEHGKWDAVQQVWGEEARETLRKYEWVSNQVKSVLRRTDLSFSHHEVIADLTPDKQTYWLEQAAAQKWSVAVLHQRIKDATILVKLGDLWQLGKHRIMCGDAYKQEDIDYLIGEDHINAVVSDPPYGIGYKPDWDKWDGSKSDYTEVIGDDTEFDPSPFLSYPTVVLFGANYFSNKLPLGGWICWDKRLDETKDAMFGSPFEMAWFRSINTNKKAIMIRVLHAGVVNADSKTGNNQKRLHPTQKPVIVMEQIINHTTEENDIVLDPFSGSGSTLLACNNKNRLCLAMEIDPSYVSMTLDRWKNEIGEQPVFIGNYYGGH